MKVASISSATLALLAGAALTTAYAADEPAVTPAETAVTPASVDKYGATIFEPGTYIKTTDDLFVMWGMGAGGNPDGSISGAGGVSDYDLSGIQLTHQTQQDGVWIHAKVDNAITIPAENIDTTYTSAIGSYSSSDTFVVGVSQNGSLDPKADGAAIITFTPIIIEDSLVTYSGQTFTIDVTVTNGEVTVGEATELPAPVETPAPAESTLAPPEPTEPTTAEDLIPALGTKISLAEGLLFVTSVSPVLNADGSNTGLATVPTSAFEGSYAVVNNSEPFWAWALAR